VQELAGRNISIPCDVTSLQHPPLIGRDESRDTAGGGGGAGDVGGAATLSGMAASGGSTIRSSWRCDVCGYSTLVARNLRIHMTSEKHAHNVAVLQRQTQQMRLLQQLNAAAAANNYHQPSSMSSLPWSNAPSPAAPFLSLPTPVDLTRPPSVGQTRGPLYTCSLCPYRTSLRANFHLHCQTDKHAQRVHQFAMTVTAANTTRSPSQRCTSPDDNDHQTPGIHCQCCCPWPWP